MRPLRERIFCVAFIKVNTIYSVLPGVSSVKRKFNPIVSARNQFVKSALLFRHSHRSPLKDLQKITVLAAVKSLALLTFNVRRDSIATYKYKARCLFGLCSVRNINCTWSGRAMAVVSFAVRFLLHTGLCKGTFWVSGHSRKGYALFICHRHFIKEGEIIARYARLRRGG